MYYFILSNKEPFIEKKMQILGQQRQFFHQGIFLAISTAPSSYDKKYSGPKLLEDGS
jgi:type IV secretory pathway protease TraF